MPPSGRIDPRRDYMFTSLVHRPIIFDAADPQFALEHAAATQAFQQNREGEGEGESESENLPGAFRSENTDDQSCEAACDKAEGDVQEAKQNDHEMELNRQLEAAEQRASSLQKGQCKFLTKFLW